MCSWIVSGSGSGSGSGSVIASAVRRRGVSIALFTATTLTLPTAWGNDRPYQLARTAILEEDAQSWSFESWVQRLGSVRGLSVEPEYTFRPGTTVQVELSRYLDRRVSDTGHEAEVEVKQIFKGVAPDGWGWGVSAALSAERTRESDGTVPSMRFKVPLSIAWGGDGGGYLHFNAGISKTRDVRRNWTGAVALERELLPRTLFFGELARESGATFAQVGARHWLRRDKLAIDFSLQQQRMGGSRSNGFIVGLGWYDF